MSSLLRLLALTSLLTATAACSGGADGDGDTGGQGNPDASSSETDAGTSGAADAGSTGGSDAGVSGDVDAGPGDPDAGATAEGELDLRSVYGVVNADDDDDTGNPDWFQQPFASDNDLSSLPLPDYPGHTIELTLSGETQYLRVWNASNQMLLGTDLDDSVTTQVTVPADGSTLRVEFGWYLAKGALSARLVNSSGTAVDTDLIDLWSSPLILNHHLQPSEHVYVVSTPNGGDNNVAMVNSYQAVLSSNAFTAVPGNQVGFDIWMQDEFEFGTSTGDDGQRMDTVVDSIRDRGLDPLPEALFSGPEYYVGTWGNANANSYDSFGNLEVSPPVTVNGVEYPFGRVYYGDIGNQGPNGTVGAFLEEQKIQDPFTVNTSWLCVGHIDEVTSWIPDPSSALGYKLLIADVPSAFAALDGTNQNLSGSRYGASGFFNTNDFETDIAFRNENMDIQDDYLTPMTNAFKAATGVTDADIIKVPALFEDVGCGMAALIPGTVNLIVADDAQSDTHLFIPKPFIDSLEDVYTSLFPAGSNMHFVDDWFSYHALLGEVHCGTNVERTPLANWWEEALHLVQ